VLRFVLLGSVTLAVIGFIFFFARVAMIAFSPNVQPHSDRALKNAGVACCVIAVLGSAMLFLLPLVAQNNTETSTKRNDASITDSSSAASKNPSEAAVPKTAKVTINLVPSTNPPNESNDSRARRNSDDAAAQLLGTLFQGAAEERAAEKERQYQQFRQGLSNLSKCPRCGGAGTYRYVDALGVLQSANCPSCKGAGGSYGSSPLFGNP
jgi:hypothetical protein